MKIIPIKLKDANQFIEKYHRHNKPVVGHIFCIGLEKDDELIGVGIAGRPIARYLDNGRIIEITRVCVKDGNKNGSSKLYRRLHRIAQLMGYEKVITYTLARESQSSMKAINAIKECEIKGQEWNRKSRERKSQDVYIEDKIRWWIK